MRPTIPVRPTIKTFKLPDGWIWWCRVDPAGHTIHAWRVPGLAGHATPQEVTTWMQSQ